MRRADLIAFLEGQGLNVNLIYRLEFDLEGFTVHSYAADDHGRILMNRERDGGLSSVRRELFEDIVEERARSFARRSLPESWRQLRV